MSGFYTIKIEWLAIVIDYWYQGDVMWFDILLSMRYLNEMRWDWVSKSSHHISYNISRRRRRKKEKEKSIRIYYNSPKYQLKRTILITSHIHSCHILYPSVPSVFHTCVQKIKYHTYLLTYIYTYIHISLLRSSHININITNIHIQLPNYPTIQQPNYPTTLYIPTQ